MVIPLLLCLSFLLAGPTSSFGQCNPFGNISRYEFDIDPTISLNLVNQQFCTSQDESVNCCGNSGNRCLDIVFNLDNGPNGEPFTENCKGYANFMTSQGNFKSLFFNIGIPNPAGNVTNCTDQVDIGNNYTISVSFCGTNAGQVLVELKVTDNNGMVVFTDTQTADPGQAVIFTACKPGFGCLNDEIIFGCCTVAGTLAVAPNAPSTICVGSTSTIKLTGSGGTAPYIAMLKACGLTDTSFFSVTINDDMDGDPTMDMTTHIVSPTETTVYTLISIEDATGCAKPGDNQNITINVNPIPQVDPVDDQVHCAGAIVPATVLTSTVPGAVITWTRTNPMPDIGLGSNSGTGNVPSFTATNTSGSPITSVFEVVASFTSNGVTCTSTPIEFSITINPTPTVNQVPNQVFCAGAAVPETVFSSNVPGAVFSWSRTVSMPDIGLVPTAGTSSVPAYSATNNSNASITSTFSVVASFTANGVTCMGTPVNYTVTIHPVPNAVATPAAQTICSGNAITTIVLSGNVPGTIFNWTRNNTASVTGIAANGSGNISGSLTNTTNAPITVTFSITPSTSNCPGTPITATVLVNPTPAVFAVTGGGLVCTTDNIGVAIGLGGSQTNVNYQLRLNGNPTGAPVAGTGAAISFGTHLTAGTYTVVATHTQGGCTSVMSGIASVASYNCSAVITDPCVCLNNATTLSNGQFSESLKINAPGTQTWTVTAVDGLYTAGSPAPPAAPLSIPAGTLLVNIGGNMFTLNGKHIDAIGYTITVSNSNGTSFNLGNTCQYPNPEFTVDLNGTFCLNSDPVTLTGNPGDANIVSQGFTVNGVPATQFDPGQGVGQYEIVYTVNGGSAKAFGPDDPGCIQSVSQIVNVVSSPDNLVCNDLVFVALDADCVEEILPDMILEGTYLCFDDYIVELDCTLPYGNGPWQPAIVDAGDIGNTCLARVTHISSGNKCFGDVKIVDNLPPAMVCEPFPVPCNTPDLSPDYLQNVLNIDAAYPGVTDCQNFSLTWTDTETDQNCASGLTKIIQRRWTATDASGNISTCVQNISLIRPTLADVVLPPNYDDFDAPAFDCTVTYPSPDWIEDQGLQGFPYVFGAPLGCNINSTFVDLVIDICDGTYRIRREWTIVDFCTGIFLKHDQVINVVDDQGPELVCPPNMTVSTDPLACCATVDLPNVILEDICSRINKVSGLIATFDPETGDPIGLFPINGTLQNFPGNNLTDPDTLAAFGFTKCLPVGAQTVTYTAQDDCGNTSTCSFEVKVEDLAPPVAACDETTIVALTTNGTALVNASTFDDGSYDNCCLDGFLVARMFPSTCGDTVFATTVPFCCDDLGEIISVIFRVTDCSGNTNDCMVLVEVQDQIKPSCQAPLLANVNCENFDPSLWVYGNAKVQDNCCLDSTKVYQGQFGLLHSANYALFDTVCNRGTITRTFRTFDCNGNSNQCTQRIIVTYEQDYFVKFPDDVIVTVCDGTNDFGQPVLFGEDCELLGISFEDQIYTVVPDACYKIERTWTIINWCTYDPNLPCINVPNPTPNANSNAAANLPGPIVSACGTIAPWAPTLVKINSTDPSATNYCLFYDKNANCYKYKQIIKVIDGQAPSGDFTVPECSNQNWFTANEAQLWNESYWWDAGFQSNDLAEEPTELCITATDACSGSNVNIEYLLFLDLDNDGTMETVVNSVNTGIAGLGWNAVRFNNLNTPNFSGGTVRAFDERQVPVTQKYGFTIQETIAGTTKTACVRWNTQQQQNDYVVPELPHGTHKIKWFVTDGCGNNKEYEYTFTVKDCKAPTVVCLAGPAVNIMPTGMITLMATDFLQFTGDNVTPSNKIKIGIRKCGTGSGIPLDANGDLNTSLNFTCADVGFHCIEIWGIDAAGNADYCETFGIVQDNLGVCSPGGTVVVSGALKNEATEGVEEANAYIIGTSSLPFTYFDMTDEEGNYQQSVPLAASFTIAPEKDDNPLNGVTTYDLVLISKHILGLAPLDSPYKMIAADANKSGSITTFDILELRKLILGIYTELPNNTSWRFVDKAFVFPNAVNPFQTSFPESVMVDHTAQYPLTAQNFVGIKIGDVNNSAIPNSILVSEDRSHGTVIFDIEDRNVVAGEEFELTFKSAQALIGFQFTMLLHGLEAIGVIESEQVNASNFGLAFDGSVTVSMDGAQEFSLRFRAKRSGTLSQMINVSGSITRAEAYMAGEELLEEAHSARHDVAFRFSGKTISGVGFELYQNQPNPFVNKTSIGFYLPEVAEATLSVVDETGRVVYQQKGQFAKGENSISLDRALLNTTGMLYYNLETATNSATKRMIQVK